MACTVSSTRLLPILLSVLFLACSGDSEPKSDDECPGNLSPCEGGCVDLRNDDANCGVCGEACEEDEVCDFGRCVAAPCPEGRTSCDGRCVDTERNVNHCGECNYACTEGEVCWQGQCSESCGGELQNCDGTCVDLAKDRENCGACGTTCGEGEVCTRGTCSSGCSEDEEVCDQDCVDTSSDAEHCGTCGNACPSGQLCLDGSCGCPEGQSYCGGTCIDTTSDPDNCGGCNVQCSGDVPHATGAVCQDSACVLTCVSGRGDCDGILGNGCEADLTADDVAHCGACNNDCETAPNVSGAICLTGVCYITADGCHDGWHDGNGDPSDGCEVDTDVHPEFCGPRLLNCTGLEHTVDQFCEKGECDFQCAEGWDDCNHDPEDGCEQDVATDVENCGGCGIHCDPGGSCVDGECRPDFEIANWRLPWQPLEQHYKAEDGSPLGRDDDIVLDEVTGLVWQRSPSEGSFHAWEDAQIACKNLGMGGGWRLPTVIELLTLVDTTRTGPAIVAHVFEYTAPSSYYWTATPSAASDSQAWAVQSDKGTATVQTKTNAYRVRCVRGGNNAAPGRRFQVEEDYVIDRKTALMWDRRPLGSTMNWSQAAQTCASWGLGGYEDWRVPTKLELETLVDRRSASPMIDTDVFPGVSASYYWTATPDAGSSTYAWRVSFANGASEVATQSTAYRVICVRDADGDFSAE